MALSIDQREAFVRQNGVCFRCLQTGHIARECKRDYKCSICQGRHHAALHGTKGKNNNPVDLMNKRREQQQHHAKVHQVQETVPEPTTRPSIDQQNQSALQAENSLKPDQLPSGQSLERQAALVPDDVKFYYFRCYQADTQETISLRFVVANISNPKTNKTKTIGILVDDGSNMTLLDSHVAEALGLEGQKHPLAVLGVRGQKQEIESQVSVARLAHINGSVSKNIVIRTMPNPTGGLEVTQWQKYNGLWPHLKHLKLVDIPPGLKVHMILGNDQGFFHRSLQELYHPTDIDAPVARLTSLGWTITGRVIPKTTSSSQRVVMNTVANIFRTSVHAQDVPEIPESLRWVKPEHFKRPEESEDTERPPIINPDDRAAMKILQDRTQSTPQGRVLAPVLWKSALRPINNFYAAKQVWTNLQKRLKKNPDQYKAYDQNFQKWLDAGYARIVKGEDPLTNDQYFLTHFPVIREDKTTSKLRVVMNGKAAFNGNPSLNDYIHKGPKLINDLVKVLLRFRRYKIAVTGDIKEMFLRVLLSEGDARFHRILYSFSNSDQLLILEALVHMFGNCGSPAVVIFVIKWKAYAMRHICPLAAAAILDGSIVDDCMESVQDQDQASRLIKELLHVFNQCGMVIHKWASSDPTVLPGAGLEVKSFSEPSQDFPEGKALGLYWHTQKDCLQFKLNAEPPEIWTKLSTLKHYMSLFDPLGLVLPFVVKARFLFKETWDTGLSWDQPLPKNLSNAWTKWHKAAQELPSCSFPRWIQQENIKALHAFGDASGKGYGACIYLVTTTGNTTLICAKGRVVSNPAKTIPQAEVDSCSMVLALVRLVSRTLGHRGGEHSLLVRLGECLILAESTKQRLKQLLRQEGCPNTRKLGSKPLAPLPNKRQSCRPNYKGKRPQGSACRIPMA